MAATGAEKKVLCGTDDYNLLTVLHERKEKKLHK